MKDFRVVETSYRGPTDHKPSRVRVKDLNTGKVVWESYEAHSGTHGGSLETFTSAARAVLGCEPEWFSHVEGGGYLFGVSRSKPWRDSGETLP